MPCKIEMPKEFGDYQLLKEIGRGSAGVVYQARQMSLDRMVALKMIRSDRLATEQDIVRFHTEAKTAARLRHPNIVTVYEVGEVHGQHYFAMEYINGESLASRIKNEPMPLDQAITLLSIISRAVHHLHNEGIIHRDLKPSNIMLGSDGQPHVTDFGLAMMLRAGMKSIYQDVIAGTPYYMSPEQASGNLSIINHQTDIYCLGVILYQLLVGRPPFMGKDLTDTLIQIIERDPVPPTRLSTRIPREIEWICLCCLEKKPERRYPSALALAEDLYRFQVGEEIETQPPTPLNRLRRWIRRAPALAVHWFAIVIFIINSILNFMVFGIFKFDYFAKTLAFLLTWIPVCYIFHRWLQNEKKVERARLCWASIDVAFFTAILLLGKGVSSALIIGYPLLIVGSCLWFRTRLVWFMTGLVILSYGVLLLDSFFFRPEMSIQFDRYVIFIVSMVILGIVVACQVSRIHALERYFHSRKLH